VALNYVDLFHGIGGFALGAYWAGMKFDTHYCSDIEPYAVELYAKRFPDSVQLGDITKIDWVKLKKENDGEWIMSGGFPCQDISIAGKGAGIEGKRSGLWFEYWKGISTLRPRYAIMENVGMLTHRGLDAVLSSLSEIGYNAEWQDIRAEDVGAPHRRERIWIIAYPESTGDRRQQRRCVSKDEQHKEKNRTAFRSEFDHGNNVSGKTEMAHSELRGRLHGQTEKQPAKGRLDALCDTGTGGSKVADTEGKRCKSQSEGATELRPQEREGVLRGSCDVFNSWKWKTEPAVGRLVDGLPGRVDRLKGLGNAIVPQIAEILFKLIKDKRGSVQGDN